jgi:hypothetical protein
MAAIFAEVSSFIVSFIFLVARADLGPLWAALKRRSSSPKAD